DVMVYNRWGEVLWKSTESEKSWNGQANGKLVKLGFYFYRFTGVDMNGNNIEDNGMIHVLY
ncbi:MAG: gliding motility-associated-like protein, partial [Bacteroidia bacterium]